MKRILITAIVVLLALGVNAQAGMPRELTCTEEAFNFSFSLGSGWKFAIPKMGPLEILNGDAVYNPIWRLKVNGTAPQSNLLYISQMPFPGQLKQDGFGPLTKPGLLFPGLHFHPLIDYTNQNQAGYMRGVNTLF